MTKSARIVIEERLNTRRFWQAMTGFDLGRGGRGYGEIGGIFRAKGLGRQKKGSKVQGCRLFASDFDGMATGSSGLQRQLQGLVT